MESILYKVSVTRAGENQAPLRHTGPKGKNLCEEQLSFWPP